MDIATEFWSNYQRTPLRLKICDTFCVYYVSVALIVTAYCFLFGSFPFNAFLSALFASTGSFVLTVSLRMQSNPSNAAQFRGITLQSAFTHFALSMTLLLLVCVHFMG
eukprot:NODE_7488_length_471_cov_68.888626_g7044_i0.p1 GENE.NODE_7488_length_471_cov_68.888626_g7044_i0~~NODE_7488_length_471_cov_68.888626_g7044_i0.p1  ORF type:complete len:108 (+),score=11.66 NODE_7488_length_471_cov_68.888626_g7044_i0:68-391(+)